MVAYSEALSAFAAAGPESNRDPGLIVNSFAVPQSALKQPVPPSSSHLYAPPIGPSKKKDQSLCAAYGRGREDNGGFLSARMVSYLRDSVGHIDLTAIVYLCIQL